MKKGFTTRGEVMRCAVHGQNRKECATCAYRFVCLTDKPTKDDMSAYFPFHRYLMNLPNNKAGNKLYKEMCKALNSRTWRLQRYGRGKNRKAKGGTCYHMPIKKCDYFGVYLHHSTEYNKARVTKSLNESIAKIYQEDDE